MDLSKSTKEEKFHAKKKNTRKNNANKNNADKKKNEVKSVSSPGMLDKSTFENKDFDFVLFESKVLDFVSS